MLFRGSAATTRAHQEKAIRRRKSGRNRLQADRHRGRTGQAGREDFTSLVCQVVRRKSAERCGSPAATSKGHRPFEAPTEPTGETSSLQGSRVKPLPSDMMLCVISYWVLSGAKWRQIQQLRCCALSRQAVEMKEAPAKPYTKIRKK